jgi:ketosteroid isomerase-like protein
MRFGVRTLLSLAIAFVVVSPLVAQEWSAEQKEVWAFETAYWNAVAARDVAGVMSHVHDSYRGWSYDGSVPGTKEVTKMAMSHYFPITKSFGHNATPLAILVSGNTAVVHYYIGFHGTNEKGDHESTQDRWTDTLIKEGGKWLLLADHGGDVAKLK